MGTELDREGDKMMIPKRAREYLEYGVQWKQEMAHHPL